jgi:hypothetical protein
VRIKKRIVESRELAMVDVADHRDPLYGRTRRHGHREGASPEQFDVNQERRRLDVH